MSLRYAASRRLLDKLLPAPSSSTPDLADVIGLIARDAMETALEGVEREIESVAYRAGVFDGRRGWATCGVVRQQDGCWSICRLAPDHEAPHDWARVE